MASKNSRRHGHATRGRHIARPAAVDRRALPGRPGRRRRVAGDGLVARGDRLRADPRASARVRAVGSGPRPTSIGACWARSSSTWAAPSTPACTSPARRSADAKGFRTGRGSRGQGAGRADRPLPGRELRLGLQLARRRRPEGPAADGARSRVEHARVEPVRHQRLHRLVRAGRRRAAARHELRHGQRRDRRWPTSSTATCARGTRWSDLRRAHGYEQPHNVRYWCLGNEMDGPWQIGQLQAREYGRKARDAAKQMRVIDPRLQLIACGSSGTFMPTYLAWDREVLEECYDQVDGLSLHAYYGNTKELVGQQRRALSRDEPRHGSPHPRGGGRVRLRAGPAALAASACGCRSTNGTSGIARATSRRPTADGAAAPRLLEEVYNLEDALLVGGFVNTLLRNSDRVRVACLAQLVNVIAPLVTNDQGVLRQSTYYPYAWALRYARGRVLDLRVESETYPISGDRPAGRLRAHRRRAVRRRRGHARRVRPGRPPCWCSIATWTTNASWRWNGTTSSRSGCSRARRSRAPT